MQIFFNSVLMSEKKNKYEKKVLYYTTNCSIGITNNIKVTFKWISDIVVDCQTRDGKE